MRCKVCETGRWTELHQDRVQWSSFRGSEPSGATRYTMNSSLEWNRCMDQPGCMGINSALYFPSGL